jgi:outer membrane cobalamin receptor
LKTSAGSEARTRAKSGARVAFLIALLAVFPGPPAVFAGDPAALHRMDAVVVSAERIEERRTGDVDTEVSPTFHTVVPRERFEARTTDLGDVLQKEAGVQVRRSGGLGGFSEVSLRGASSEQVMVFLDGIPLNEAAGGGVDLGAFSLSDVAAVEIYRGVTPMNLGRASVGGAVNLRTIRAEDGFSASATGRYGSFDTRGVSTVLTGRKGVWDGLLSAEYLASDNDFRFLNDNGTPFNPADDREERRINADFDRFNLLGKIGRSFGNARLDLVHQSFFKDQNLPDWRNTPVTRTNLDTERRLTALRLTADRIGPLNLAFQFDHSRRSEEYDDRLGQIGLGRQHNRYATDRFGGHVFGEIFLGDHLFTALLDLRRESYDSDDLLGTGAENQSDRDTLSAGIGATLFFLGERLILTPGLRYAYVRDEMNAGIDSFGRPAPGQSDNRDHFSPQIGLKYRATPWLTFKSNLGRYVREPSFFERFGDRGFFLGNPDLQAETAVNIDAGLEARWQDGPAGARSGRASAALFHSRVDDLISRSFDARGVGKAVNISEARIRGLETGFGVSLLEWLRLTGNATFQRPENRSEIAAFDGKRLPGRFDLSWRLRAEADWREFTLFGEYGVREDMYYDTANLLPAADREEFNLGLSRNWRDWTVSLEGRNLQDNQYEDFNGFPLPGRAVYLTARYRFETGK